MKIEQREYQAMPEHLQALFTPLPNPGSDEVVGLFPENVKGQVGKSKTQGGYRFIEGDTESVQKFDYGRADSGSAARFFYCAKASKADRNEGLFVGLQRTRNKRKRWQQDKSGTFLVRAKESKLAYNSHPTVKPTDLMRYLCRLITPPGGVILDPFMGSGSTGKAARLEGFKFIGIDSDQESFYTATKRIEAI